MESKPKTYLTTRPRVATAAANKGFIVRQCFNPFEPSKKAWEIDLTPESARMIAEFFRGQLDKPVPSIVQAYLDEVKGAAE